jgi:hypothetical protein
VPGRDAIAVLAKVPRAPRAQVQSGLITRALKVTASLPGFAASLERLDLDAVAAAPDTALDALTSSAAERIVAGRSGRSRFAFIHALTGSAAMRTLLPALHRRDRRAALGHAVQAVAAVHAAYGDEGDDHDAPSLRTAALSPDELATRAAATLDDHAIKLTEAALAEHARSGREIFLAAATRVVLANE